MTTRGVAMRWLVGYYGGFLAALAAGCGGPQRAPDVIVVDTPGAVSIRGEVWADNWFAFYLDDRRIIEDSIPITTERSFNAEAFVFNAEWPSAVEHGEADVRPRGGYDAIGWRDGARLIRTADLETHSTLLCRLTVEQR